MVVDGTGERGRVAGVDLDGESAGPDLGRGADETASDLVKPAERATDPNRVMGVIGECGRGSVIGPNARAIAQKDGCHAGGDARAVGAAGTEVGVTGAPTVPVPAFHLRRIKIPKPPLVSTKATCLPSAEMTGEVRI